MLSETNQTQKDKHCKTPLTLEIQSSQIHKNREQSGSFQRLERGGNIEILETQCMNPCMGGWPASLAPDVGGVTGSGAGGARGDTITVAWLYVYRSLSHRRHI